MRTTIMHLTAFGLTTAPLLAAAHPGHGEAGASHGHATDTWGWALGLAVAALGWWLARRR